MTIERVVEGRDERAADLNQNANVIEFHQDTTGAHTQRLKRVIGGRREKHDDAQCAIDGNGQCVGIGVVVVSQHCKPTTHSHN